MVLSRALQSGEDDVAAWAMEELIAQGIVPKHLLRLARQPYWLARVIVWGEQYEAFRPYADYIIRHHAANPHSLSAALKSLYEHGVP